ncbi:MAG: hypothetical protein JXB14_04955 [Candidatus Altiarchaeota archaeon]|nr:hypothetical protein [Candidatus Altiarchaeota archaeon]
MLKHVVTPVVIRLSVLLYLCTLLSLSLTLFPQVCAIPFPANTTWMAEFGTNYTGASDYDITEGGNITFLNLEAQQSTGRWAGYVGNVSGSIVLSDGSSIFFRWNDTTSDGRVCAGTANNYNWTTIFALADITQLDTAWGFAVGTDQADNTFNRTHATCGDIGSNDITADSSKTGPDNPAADAFETCVVNDEDAANTDKFNMAFCVLTDRTGSNNDYRGSGDSDYELLVPTAEGSTETYYFFLEL